MHDVFISYSHKDVQVADAICHKLEEQGVRCWYAPRNIQAGAEWAEAIVEALEGCEVMVLVFTDYSNSSQQVLREVDTAITAGKAVIPFKRTESMPTGSMRYYLSSLHWLDAVDEPLEEAIDELVKRICGLLGREMVANVDAQAHRETEGVKDTTVSPQASGPTAPAKNRIALFAGIVAVCLAAVLGAFLLGRGASKEPASIPQQEETQEQASGVEADAAATDSMSTEAGEATGDGNDTAYGASTSEEARPQIAPQPGDEEAKDNYLYTLFSNDTEVRLDRYMGPEVAELVIPTTIEGLPVTSIGEKCFEDATWIERLVLPEALETISYRAFYGCSSLREMNIPSSLTHISGWAFAHTGFTDIVFPETFESLDYGAFYGSDLRNCVLSSKIDWLGENTFRMCPDLQSVTIPAAEVEINAKAFEADTDVTIIGVPGSYTEKYAKGMNLKFEAYGG